MAASTISRRDDIVDNITTELATITKANGYNLDISLVDEKLQEVMQVADKDLPALFVIDGTEKKADKDVDGLECELNIIIIGYVKTDYADVTPSELLRKMIADVEKCLCADRSRGGIAFQTLLTEVKTDEGLFTPRGVMNMTFLIKYNQKFGDPKNAG